MKNIKIKNKQSKDYKNGWVKVADLSVGDTIAVRPRPEVEPALSAKGQEGQCQRRRASKTRATSASGSEILWDEIVSIKSVGREKVYDIEIEDTHNFVGNDIFAHNTYIGGNVGIGVATPVAKLQINDAAEAAFVVTSDGRVGVGTTTPAYKMSVVGDIAATAFVNISTKDSKIDIQYLTGEEEASVLDKIKNTNVATYHYNLENPDNPKRLGLIAENAPAEVLSIDGKGVDIYKLSTFTLAGLKAMQVKVDSIETRVTALETGYLGASLPSGSEAPSGLISNLVKVAKSTLASLASTIGNWANAALAETSKLFMASEDASDVSYKTYNVQGSREEIQISGSATLVIDPESNGAVAHTRVKFDESFSSIISDTASLTIIVTPATRLNGTLYVHERSRYGFEVRETNAQDEGGMFDWIVIARRAGSPTDANTQIDANDANNTATSEPVITPSAQSEPTPSETPSEPTPSEPVIPPTEEVTPSPAPASEEPPPAEEPAPVVEEPVAPPVAEEPAAVPPVEEVAPTPAETPPTEEVVPPVPEEPVVNP